LKAFATKLDPVANHVIISNQTMFIKGIFILDSVLVWHKIVDKLKPNKSGEGASFSIVSTGLFIEVLRSKGFNPMVIHHIS
jgi:uncharacterized membrane protein